MSAKPLVRLVFDAYGVFRGEGTRISGLDAEKEAFAEIEDLLSRDSRFETVQPRTYIVGGANRAHFDTYEATKGVVIEEITPRTQIRELVRDDPPDWLVDEDICRWGLLNRDGPDSVLDEGWGATIASWLMPGIVEVASLEQWFEVVAASESSHPYGTGPVSAWVQESFTALASRAIESDEVVAELRAALTRAESPVQFSREWLWRRALLPLGQPSVENPLRLASVELGSPRERVLAGYLPLVFPLPGQMHEEVSRLVRRAMQQARIADQGRLSDAVMRLNAIWSGVAEELRIWLDTYPRGLTGQAADHLGRLPGFESSELARRMVARYRPPEKMRPWAGLGAGFDEWVNEYARFVRSCFIRRSLSEDDDPAESFGTWLKDNYTVSFDHPERSYCGVAQRITSQLKHDRCVILLLVDALAIHLAQDLVGSISGQLGCEYTSYSYLFAPIPTTTEVCKNAILTGSLPNDCCSDMRKEVCNAYRIRDEDVVLAADWQDAERVDMTETTRLVVYRDNGIDDRLHKVANYVSLLEDSAGVFRKIASRVKRWASDLECISGQQPYVILTADHGFTFGPQPGTETKGQRVLDGKHRCVAVDGEIRDVDRLDESITVIDRDECHLARHYLAARGRHFGKDTMSGWALSHGGLLPEEVVIPVFEWFGDEIVVLWPRVDFPEGAYCDAGSITLPLELKNTHGSAISGGLLSATLLGENAKANVDWPRIEAFQSKTVEFVFNVSSIPDTDVFGVDVTLRVLVGATREEKVTSHKVARAKRLVERTNEQDDFENMFGPDSG